MSAVQGGSRQFPRPTRSDLPFITIALASGIFLLYLGRSLTFWHDEWRSITFDGGALDYLRPVNQHWSTFPLSLYRATFSVVGLDSYLPYLAQVVALHLGAVAAAYALMRARLGPLVATSCSIPLLLLGSGAENLFWAFQTGFVGSVLFGLWALFFIERWNGRGAVVAAILLTASLASSGMGLFFVVVVGARSFLDLRLRPSSVAVVPPLAAYAAWLLVFGGDSVGDGRVFLEGSVLRFAVRGVVHAAESASGLERLPDGHIWALGFLLALCAVVGLRLARGRRPALAAACLVGLGTMYVAIGFVRVDADPGYDHATASRFVYVAAFLLALAVVDLLAERPARSGSRARDWPVVPALLGLILAAVTASNVGALLDERAAFQERAEDTRALVAVVLESGSEPWVDRVSARGWMPSVAELERIVQRHGSPLRDRWFAGLSAPPDAEALEEARLNLAGAAFRVEPARPGAGAHRAEIRAGHGTIPQSGGCVEASVAPDTPLSIVSLPSQARVRVTAAREVELQIFVGRAGGPARRIFGALEAGVAHDVLVPYVGDDRRWNLLIDSPHTPVRLSACARVPRGADGGITAEARSWE